MFSGIIRGIGKIENTTKISKIKKVSIKAPENWKFREGESVSVSGICSTVVSSKKNIFNVDYMPETLLKSTAVFFEKGDEVNLEKSLKIGDSLDGHFVYGHIEGVGKVLNILNKGKSKVLSISLPKNIAKYVANKGSIAIDGVSLTVSGKKGSIFNVSLIPYTLSDTTLSNLEKGDKVNIESDIIAKYIIKK